MKTNQSRAAAETATTTMRGTCHDCSQGAGFKDRGFELYMDDDNKPSHWFCCYCGSNHVTIIDAAGNALYDGGTLY